MAISADFDPAGGSEVRCQFGDDRHGCAAAGVRFGRHRAAPFPREGRQAQACQGCVSGVSEGDEGTGLHEEGSHRMLEGGDRAEGVGEGGLEMGEDLRRRSVRGLSR